MHRRRLLLPVVTLAACAAGLALLRPSLLSALGGVAERHAPRAAEGRPAPAQEGPWHTRALALATRARAAETVVAAPVVRPGAADGVAEGPADPFAGRYLVVVHVEPWREAAPVEAPVSVADVDVDAEGLPDVEAVAPAAHGGRAQQASVRAPEPGTSAPASGRGTSVPAARALDAWSEGLVVEEGGWTVEAAWHGVEATQAEAALPAQALASRAEAAPSAQALASRAEAASPAQARATRAEAASPAQALASRAAAGAAPRGPALHDTREPVPEARAPSAQPAEAGAPPASTERDALAVRDAALPSDVARLVTAWVDGARYTRLQPCVRVAVAGVYTSRREARLAAEALQDAGIGAVMRPAGALAPDAEARTARCRAEAAEDAARAVRATEPRRAAFVERRGGRTLLLLSDAPGAGPSTGAWEDAGDGSGLWWGALAADPAGRVRAGDAFDVYDARGLRAEGCRVEGFTWVNRAVPHEGHLQQWPPPSAPPCAGAWPAAVLGCELQDADGREPRGAEAMGYLALPAGGPAPRYLERDDAEALALQRTEAEALRQDPGYLDAHDASEAYAQAHGAPLLRRVTQQVWADAQGVQRLAVTEAELTAGEGLEVCGRDSHVERYARLTLETSEGARRALQLPRGASAEQVRAVLDVDGDGAWELLLSEDGVAGRLRLVGEDGTERVQARVERCDAACGD